MVKQVFDLGQKNPRERFSERGFGLYSVAEPYDSEEFGRPDLEVEWTDWCAKARTWDLPCQESPGEEPPEQPDKVSDGPSINDSSEQFTVYFMPQCTDPSGRGIVIDAALEIGSATEQKVVERAFWTEILEGCTPAVGDGDDLCEVRTAFGAVEQAIVWAYPGKGVIHVPLWALAYLTDVGIVERVGGQLQTTTGTPVVAGVGYFGAPSTLPDVAGFYIVGTGDVRVTRGPVIDPTVTYLFDTDQNFHNALAERKVAVGYDCLCVYAAVGTTCVPNELAE